MVSTLGEVATSRQLIRDRTELVEWGECDGPRGGERARSIGQGRRMRHVTYRSEATLRQATVEGSRVKAGCGTDK